MITRSSPSEFSAMGDAELIAHGRGIVQWNDMQTDERSKDNQKTNMIAALIAALAARQWQPMETAPEDSDVDLWARVRSEPNAGYYRIADCYYDAQHKRWLACNAGWVEVYPSRWIAALAPPEGKP